MNTLYRLYSDWTVYSDDAIYASEEGDVEVCIVNIICFAHVCYHNLLENMKKSMRNNHICLQLIPWQRNTGWWICFGWPDLVVLPLIRCAIYRIVGIIMQPWIVRPVSMVQNELCPRSPTKRTRTLYLRWGMGVRSRYSSWSGLEKAIVWCVETVR